MERSNVGEKVAITRSHSDHGVQQMSDDVKEPSKSSPVGNGDENVTMDNSLIKIDKAKMEQALMQLIKSNCAEISLDDIAASCGPSNDDSAQRNQGEETMLFPSSDVRLKKSASHPEIHNSLNHSPGAAVDRPAYKWENDSNEDDFMDRAWTKATELMSPRERDRWRKSLYSVYVGHLPIDITKKELYELFTVAGCAQDCHLADSPGKTFTYGFVRFASYGEAKEAVQTCHGKLLAGRHIVVEFANETQHLLDKDGADNSVKEKDGKLLRKHLSKQQYKTLSADEADEKMMQWKLRQSTEKLKSSHAVYVRDYMRTEEAARRSTSVPSAAVMDQEETLNKIQEILKKVADIPGAELAASAVGDEGPEQTIGTWFQENDRVNGKTQLPSFNGVAVLPRDEGLLLSTSSTDQQCAEEDDNVSLPFQNPKDLVFSEDIKLDACREHLDTLKQQEKGALSTTVHDLKQQGIGFSKEEKQLTDLETRKEQFATIDTSQSSVKEKDETKSQYSQLSQSRELSDTSQPCAQSSFSSQNVHLRYHVGDGTKTHKINTALVAKQTSLYKYPPPNLKKKASFTGSFSDPEVDNSLSSSAPSSTDENSPKYHFAKPLDKKDQEPEVLATAQRKETKFVSLDETEVVEKHPAVNVVIPKTPESQLLVKTKSKQSFSEPKQKAVSPMQDRQNSKEQINHTVSPSQSQCQTNEEAPVKKVADDPARRHANQPCLDSQQNIARILNPHSLLGSPLFYSSQFSSPAFLAQQLAPFYNGAFQQMQPRPFAPQFPSGFGFQNGVNFSRDYPYFGQGPMQGFPSNPLTSLQPGFPSCHLTPPHFPVHQIGNNTWPLQQRPASFSQSPPLPYQNFKTPPRPPPSQSAFHKGMNPQKLAPCFGAVDLGKAKEMNKNSNITPECSENVNGPKNSHFNATAVENGKESLDSLFLCSSDVKNLDTFDTEETVHNSNTTVGIRADNTDQDSTDSGASRDRIHDKFVSEMSNKSSSSISSSDISQVTSTDDTSASDASQQVNSVCKKSCPTTKRSRKLAAALQLAINTSSKDPGYSSTSSGSEEMLKGEIKGVRQGNVMNRKTSNAERDTGDSGVASPSDDLSMNEITLVELKMELERIENENRQLHQSLPKMTSPMMSSRVYPNRASAALKQKIKESEVNLQREKEIVASRKNEQELLYEREKLEAAFDHHLLKQLEVELALNSVTDKVRLAKLQQDLLKLYHQNSVMD